MRTFLFISFCAIANLVAAQKQYGYRYWFDSNDGTTIVGSTTDSIVHIDIDASSLPTGLHRLNYQVTESQNGASAVKTAMFIKMPPASTGFRYWFDGDDKSAVTGIAVAGQTVADIDASTLPSGLHLLHYQIAETPSSASVVKTAAFIKIPATATKYRYWFDDNDSTAIEGTTNGGHVEILADAATLTTGIHTLHYQIAGAESGESTVHTALFTKLPTFNKLGNIVYIDDKLQDGYTASAKGDSVVHLDIDAEHLDLGLHTIEARMIDDGGGVSQSAKSFFLKVPTAQDLASMKAYYFVDGSPINKEANVIEQGVAHVDLDMTSLQDGIHSITFLMSNDKGMATVAGSSMFLKESRGIRSYSWWINDDKDNGFTKTFNSAQSSVELMESLDPPRYPVRATKFEFTVEDSVPVAYAVNTFNFAFTDMVGNTEASQFDYIDLAAREVVVAKPIASGVSEATGNLPEDSIAWYKFIGQDGDSISLKANSACVIQVFLPTGEEAKHMEGDSATIAWSANLAANGVYYIAVHSPATLGGNINVDFYQKTDNPAVSVKSATITPKPERNVVYDLSGRRVYGKLQPGIYIINGKKVLIRK